jgi:hypothetical protein
MTYTRHVQAFATGMDTELWEPNLSLSKHISQLFRKQRSGELKSSMTCKYVLNRN